MIKQILFILSLGALLAAQTARPERKVERNVITSGHDPNVRIHLPQSVHYVGADRWALYGMADCELHAFVDANAQKDVQRLYWVQFEAYLPTRPELKHTYDSPKHATIGSMDFYVDSWVRRNDADTQTGSDVEHIMALIASKDYHMPDQMIYVRLVHLLDKQRRKELMIIYGEDVAAGGLTSPDLPQEGKTHDLSPAVAEGLLERAEQRIAIDQTRP